MIMYTIDKLLCTVAIIYIYKYLKFIWNVLCVAFLKLMLVVMKCVSISCMVIYNVGIRPQSE